MSDAARQVDVGIRIPTDKTGGVGILKRSVQLQTKTIDDIERVQ